jgi:hypothetical protein
LSFYVYFPNDNYHSAVIAPGIPQKAEINKKIPSPNPSTTGFAYYQSGLYSSQLFKFSVADPYTATLIGGVKQHVFTNGDYANPTGVWKFYVQQDTIPYTIYEVDTGTGAMTPIGAPLNLKSGHKPIDMEWDQTTNTMYMVSANSTLSETQFYSLYWPTMMLTWIGSSVTAPAAIIAGGFNANGTYFGIDIVSDALWKVNKFTGIWTEVGPLGYPVSFSQDAGFDRSDYSRMLWCACGGTVGLYEVDTATGAATLVGPFPGYSDVAAVCFIPLPGPHITHTPLQSTNNVTGPYMINALITPYGSGITTAKVYWSRNNPTVTDSVTMTNTSGNNWTGNFPGNGQTATYRYYIMAKDSLNRTATAPFGAPATLYTFEANANDTVKPVITHIPLGNIFKMQWPDTINATVTDNWGVDSVWVSWRINDYAVKHLKLLHPTGNFYTSVFNSLNSDVSIGDTIYYRIIAQDNSPNHNKDSTSLLSFRIIPSQYACIGNGNVTIAYGSPFDTYWKGYKTQLLWTADEIIANGGIAGNILKIGFNFMSVDSVVMNGFTISMQNTAIPVLNNGFITSDWITVFNGRYQITTTGWQFINLQTPFYWDGISNLLIETCYGNTITSQGNYVQGTLASGMEYYGYRDDSLACSIYPTAHGSSSRPNVCFQIDALVGNSNNAGIIPVNYSLHQNFPNPFNPFTKIGYDIPKQSFVNLRIFDVLGREVKVLVNEIKSPGSYIVDFNASGLPSGIYFYRLECNGYFFTKRMTLLK